METDKKQEIKVERGTAKIPLKRLVIFLVCLLFLSGCAEIKGWEVTEASERCSTLGGVDNIESFLDNHFATCGDGSWFKLRRKKLSD